VYPPEVEDFVSRGLVELKVMQVAVIGLPHAVMGDAVMVFVGNNAEGTLTADKVHEV